MPPEKFVVIGNYHALELEADGNGYVDYNKFIEQLQSRKIRPENHKKSKWNKWHGRRRNRHGRHDYDNPAVRIHERMFTMSAIENSKCRIRFLARGPLGRPEEVDTLIAVGVQQGHGLDEELMDRYPWLAEAASMDWLNPYGWLQKLTKSP